MEGPKKTITNLNLPIEGADMDSPQKLRTIPGSPDQVIIALGDLEAIFEKLDNDEDVDPIALDDAIAAQIQDTQAKKLSIMPNLGREENHDQRIAQYQRVNPNIYNNSHRRPPPSHHPYQNNRGETKGNRPGANQEKEKNPHVKCFGLVDDRDPCCVNCCKVFFGLILLPFILVYKLIVAIFECLIENIFAPCCKRCEDCCDSCCKCVDKYCTKLSRALEKCCNFIGKIVKKLCAPCTWVCKKIGKVFQSCCAACLETLGKYCDDCCAAIGKCCKALVDVIKPCCDALGKCCSAIFKFIGKIFKVIGRCLNAVIIKPLSKLFKFIGKVFRAIYDYILAPIGRFIRDYIFKPIGRLIKAIFQAINKYIIQPIFNLIRAIFRGIRDCIRSLLGKRKE